MILINSTATFTRPNDTTAYASGDLVANSTTAGSVTPMSFYIPGGRGVKLQRVLLKKSGATPTNANFKLHLYSDSPTCTNGDNGAWLTTNSNYQGFITCDISGNTFSDSTQGSGVYVNNSVFAPMFIFADIDSLVYGLLAAGAAYTPAAQEVFTATLLGESYY